METPAHLAAKYGHANALEVLRVAHANLGALNQVFVRVCPLFLDRFCVCLFAESNRGKMIVFLTTLCATDLCDAQTNAYSHTQTFHTNNSSP